MNQIEDMQTFVRIVEAGSITKAASQLNTVKSAVSRRLSELEKRLQVTLLTRTTRTQILTEHGTSYYQQCLRIIHDVSEIEAQLRQENSALSGSLRICAPLVFGVQHLSQALLDFNNLHPNITLDVDFNDQKVDIIEGGFDVAIRISKLQDSNLIARSLGQSQMLLCASAQYLAKNGTPKSPEQLSFGYKKLHYNGAPDNWIFIDDQQKKISVNLPTALTSNNGDFLVRAAINHSGLIYTPDFICHQAIKDGTLIPILQSFMQDRVFPIYALYPQNRHLSHKVRRLVDFLIDYFSQNPKWLLA